MPDGGRPDLQALTGGFQDAFLVGAGFALLALVIAAVGIRTQDSEAMKGEPAPVPV